jgi:hypothetical protein
MSGTFNTITGDDWTRAIKAARRRVNKVSQQIAARLLREAQPSFLTNKP